MWVNSSKDFTNGPLISWPNMRLAPKNQADASQKSHTLLILKHTETKKLKEIFLKCHTRLHVRASERKLNRNLQHNEVRLGEQGTGTGTAMDGRVLQHLLAG